MSDIERVKSLIYIELPYRERECTKPSEDNGQRRPSSVIVQEQAAREFTLLYSVHICFNAVFDSNFVINKRNTQFYGRPINF